MVAGATQTFLPTALVGREVELPLVGEAVTRPDLRLVTLTGPPGVGKTQLALAVAAAVTDRYADGEVAVDLAQVERQGSLLGEVARTLGSSEEPDQPVTERLIDVLAERELLLIIDNCEHLLPAPALTAVVTHCPNLHVLATSREPLHLAIEREIAVAPLSVPTEAELGDPDSIARSPAVRLLIERARATRHDFAITATNASDLADICIRLEGLPLALELAAAQLKLFTPSELAFRLRHRSVLLAGRRDDRPERQQGLRTAISWSHQLMPETERLLFRRCAVFVGGWTIEAAEAICTGADDPRPIDVVAATAALVDKSLVRRHTRADGTTALSMLESIREYATEQLSGQQDATALRNRHARFYADLSVRAEGGIGTAAARSVVS